MGWDEGWDAILVGNLKHVMQYGWDGILYGV